MTKPQERRHNRSERPIEALHLLLESTVRRFSLKSALLANEDGILLTLAGDNERSDTFAAFAPLLARDANDRFLRETLDLEAIQLTSFHVHPCSTPNQQVFLVTIGGDESDLTGAAMHGSAGTERILAA